MARKPRVHFPGALYHVMIRGNNGEQVLLAENDKNQYLSIMSTYKDRFDFKLYAYCIMDNHAHLLIEVSDVPLSQIMQRIQQVYTQWYNRKYHRTGHVFQQRYKALLCSKDSYLLQLIKYIHNNPVTANLKDGLEYWWSSHLNYIGKKRDSVVDINLVLSMFSSKKSSATSEYLHFMNEDEVEIKYEDSEIALMKTQVADSKTGENFSIEKIIEEVCISEEVRVEELTKKSKIQKLSDIRKAIVLLNDKYCGVPKSLLAQRLNLPPSMISKIISGNNRGTEYVRTIINKWERNKGIIQA